MTIQQLVNEHPEVLDYEICLTQFFVIKNADDEDMQIVSDIPVLCMATNSDDKELRFVIEVEDPALLKKTKNICIHLVDQHLSELRDNNDSEEDQC